MACAEAMSWRCRAPSIICGEGRANAATDASDRARAARNFFMCVSPLSWLGSATLLCCDLYVNPVFERHDHRRIDERTGTKDTTLDTAVLPVRRNELCSIRVHHRSRFTFETFQFQCVFVRLLDQLCLCIDTVIRCLLALLKRATSLCGSHQFTSLMYCLSMW